MEDKYKKSWEDLIYFLGTLHDDEMKEMSGIFDADDMLMEIVSQCDELEAKHGITKKM